MNSIYSTVEMSSASRDFSYQDYLNFHKASGCVGGALSEPAYLMVCDILNIEIELNMNYEIEAYEGELRELRKIKEYLSTLNTADVWHEGTSSWYRAMLIQEIPVDDVMRNPYG
jgi:hypothetical protein